MLCSLISFELKNASLKLFRSNSIVKGKGIVTKNGSEIRVLAGDSVDFPVNELHRVRNIGNENLVFIEIAQGDYLGEDDIVRLENKYGRT